MAWTTFCVLTPQKSAWDIVCDNVWSTTSTCDLIGNSVLSAKNGTLRGGIVHPLSPMSNPIYGCRTDFVIGILHRVRSVGSLDRASWPNSAKVAPLAQTSLARQTKCVLWLRSERIGVAYRYKKVAYRRKGLAVPDDVRTPRK